MNMMRSYNKRYAAGLLIALGILGCMGGSGGTDGGSAENPGYQDSVYTGDDATTGTMSLVVEQESLAVGQKSGFSVLVVDSQGQPVPEVSVVCDSEGGVAIIEPSSGTELTSASGHMSGVIGCAAPGSFQLLCRLGKGFNRRRFVTVRCTGDIPSGFQGFPGAAGGGLGGGVQNNDDGDVQIVEAGFEDDGSFSSTDVPADASIDYAQIADCDGDVTTVDVEPFFDTYVNLKIQNNLPERVTFSYLTYSVQVTSGGAPFESSNIGLTRQANSTLDANGQTGNLILPIFSAYGGGKWAGDPLGRGEQFTTPGLRTITFNLVGETASGSLVNITAQATASFSNFTRCSKS